VRDLAIESDGLERTFGDFKAVAGVDLAVAAGEVYGFLGPNGAGKSTTVRILCTLLAPTGGWARVAGQDVAHHPDEVRIRIGVALQDAALDDRQTGRELLNLQARLYGLRRAEAARRIDEVLELVDIGDAIDRRIGTYSGGMKRRLDLGAALVHNPEVIFLDEPTTGLDPPTRLRMWEEIRRLNRELGKTIFLTTQYLEEADVLAHRVGIIDRGVIVAEGRPDELKRALGSDVIVVEVEGPAERAVHAAEGIQGVEGVSAHGAEITIKIGNGASAVSPLAIALAAAGVEVRSLTLRQPTLDDVFLELTGSHIQPEGQAA
jgi:ABC-2 type transport system ATP-binding protein